MIEVKGLNYEIDGVQILKNLSFVIPENKVVGFLGVNGAGKTTTLDILSGCLNYESGSIKFSGVELKENRETILGQLGYLPDEPPIYNELTVTEYLDYVCSLYKLGKRQKKHKIRDIINRLDLNSVNKKLVSQLSKGFRQRVALAGVLVHSPKYIFLDEPTEGLDPNQIRVIRAIIKDLSKDHTVMLSSHILTEVESVCDEVIHIDSGEILKSGQLSDYMSTSTSSSKSYFLKIDENSIKYIPILEKLNGLKLEKVNNGFKIEFDPGVISLNQIILL